MIEYAIRSRLFAVSAVTNIIGTSDTASPRIAALPVLPQDVVFPAISMLRISSVPEYDMEGEAGVEETRLQIDCWAANKPGKNLDAYDEARRLAEAVRGALSGLSGYTSDGHTIQSCFQLTQRDLSEPELELFRVSIDFTIGHT